MTPHVRPARRCRPSIVLAVGTKHKTLRGTQSNGTMVLWRMLPRNVFGGANKNDRMEEALDTSFPHKGAVTCLAHTPLGTYGSLGGPLLFSGSTDHTIKVRSYNQGKTLQSR